MAVGAAPFMGGKKTDAQQGPPTGAKDQDEEKYIQWVVQSIVQGMRKGANNACREFIKEAEKEDQVAFMLHSFLKF